MNYRRCNNIKKLYIIQISKILIKIQEINNRKIIFKRNMIKEILKNFMKIESCKINSARNQNLNRCTINLISIKVRNFIIKVLSIALFYKDRYINICDLKSVILFT